MSERRVRVRFAPSPTGPLHIGGVRTALFNYLLAKKHGGDFLLRIEDTDQTRFVPGAEEYIIESLKWCGIVPNEGQGFGGDCGPYRQSDRKPMYREYAEQLIASGNAYIAFDTPAELDEMRARLEAAKVATPQYNAVTRQTMKNSLVLSEDEVKTRMEAGEPYVIRFKMPRNEEVRFKDIIRGWVVVNTSKLDDKVLFKSDGMPTYHLANVVDDYLMNISHVIRGEEWLPSGPLHVLLYKAFGWEDVMPEFAHLPLLLKPSGQGKLSKRDGDALGFPVFPLKWTDPFSGEISSGYRESGYFAEAFVNILAFMGWNPGTMQEIFTMDELVNAFSLERVGKSGSKFDPEKAKWFNHNYLRTRSNSELALLYQPYLKEQGIDAPLEYIEKTIDVCKERAAFVKDFWKESCYFFKAPETYDQKVIEKRWNAETPQMLAEFKELLASITPFTQQNIDTTVHEWVAAKSYNIGQLMNVIRLCLIGHNVGPKMFDVIELIGLEETVKRIDNALRVIR